ncbi:hypothetical protein MMC07_002192 [Pseudocyphellaria aurata]|nr:hypothetical protein [Pseudocyphellaria aurata]
MNSPEKELFTEREQTSKLVKQDILPESKARGKEDREIELELRPHLHLENRKLGEASGCNPDGPVKDAREFDDNKNKDEDNQNHCRTFGPSGKEERKGESTPPPQPPLKNRKLTKAGCNSDRPVKDAVEFDDDRDKDEEDKSDHSNFGASGKQDRERQLESTPQTRLETRKLSKTSGGNSDGPDEEDKDKKYKNDHGAPSMTSSSNLESSAKGQEFSKETTSRSCGSLYKRRDQHQAMAFCTQRCLRGLLTRGPLDEDCPNFRSHRRIHHRHCLDPSSFRELMWKQLAENLEANCISLDLKGSRGALYKVRLISHGYTVAAKSTISTHVSHLLHESVVYDQLYEIQGVYVPVCLGNIDLPGILTNNGAQYVHMLFLSWGGERIELYAKHANLLKELDVVRQAVEALQAIHDLGILHCDLSSQNILWSEELEHIMFIDFERSQINALPKQSLIPGSRKDQGRGEGGPSLKQADKLDAPTTQILDDGAGNKAKPKQARPNVFAFEMMRLKEGFVSALQTLR